MRNPPAGGRDFSATDVPDQALGASADARTRATGAVSYARPWGKLDRDGATGRWHAAEDHMVDVALAFRVMAGRRATRARLARAAGRAGVAEAHLDGLAVLAGLHDAGKLLRPFQDKAAGGAPAGHVAELLAALMALAPVKALLPRTID